MDVISRLLQERENLEGDLVEFGVFAGRTTEKLAVFGRRVFALDTFAGIPEKEHSGIDIDGVGKFVPPADTINRLQRLPNVFPIAGRFIDTLWVMENVKVVLAYVDCDLFLSALDAFDWLEKHLVPGGAVVLDDYQTHPGIRMAVTHFLDRNACAKFNGTETILWGGK